MPRRSNESPERRGAELAARLGTLRGRRSPPIWIWGLTAGLVVAIGCVRTGNFTRDHAIDNVITLVLVSIAAATLFGWFVFWSSYPRRLRYFAAVGVLAAILLVMGLFEVHHVSGELVPVFRARWRRRPDERLPVATPRLVPNIDLRTRTDMDFPQFLGPHREASVSGVRLEPDWQTHPPRLIWQQPIGAGWSGFSAVNGFAVTMEQRSGDELVTCYQIATGELLWSHSTPTRHATTLGGTGPKSTPTIDQGRIYTLGATGTVLCLEGGTGAMLWTDNVLRRCRVDPSRDERSVAWGRSASLLVVDDLLVVPAGGPVGGPYVSLIAFNKNTGQLVWESGHRQVAYSSPVEGTLAGQRQIVSVNQDFVSAHHVRTGELLWEQSWPGKSNADANVSQPRLLAGDRLLLTKGYGGGARLFRLEQASGGVPFRLHEIWHNPRVLRTKFTNLVIRSGHVYGLSDGILECVRLSDGRRQWKRGRYGHGQLLGVSNLLLVQAEGGQVALVDCSPTGFDELGRFTALTGKTWNNPCLYGTYLLVRNSEQAACYQLVARPDIAD